MTGESRIYLKLRGVAAKLTANEELRKDLMQEMLVHLCQVKTAQVGRTESWYVKSCEYRARNYLKIGRSVDSLKRARDLVPLGMTSEDLDGHVFCLVDAVDPADGFAELVTQEIVEIIKPQLNAMQQEILNLLMKGLGVREIARELRVTHPAVIKHRRKIGRITGALLEESTSQALS
ncbi:MAG: hypothetical protein PCFJNLEI_00700 [Verrucomicrobiae bacterium]|nr:hypothetical protein [Verrucomicrobiae bacterium]